VSLLDSFLNEPYRDPSEIWIARRPGGAIGAGSLADPFDGGKWPDPAIPVSVALDRAEVVLSSSPAHGYTSNDTLVTFGWIGLEDEIDEDDIDLFNREFPMTVVNPQTFKVTLTRAPWAPWDPDSPVRAGILDVFYSGTLVIGTLAEYMTVQVNLTQDWRTGDFVRVKDASASWRWFNGTFEIVDRNPAWIKYKVTKPGIPPAAPSGTVNVARAMSLEFIPPGKLSHGALAPNMTVRFTVDYLEHSLGVDQVVRITNVSVAPAWFNGVFRITAVDTVDRKWFEYTLTASTAPPASADGQSAMAASVLVPARVGFTWPAIRATTSVAHGLFDGLVVLLAGSEEPAVTGEFIALGVHGANGFYYRAPSSDPTIVPLGITCARLRYRFDEVMRSLPATPVVVHLGPGTFETRGFDPAGTPLINWTVQAGDTFRGSGMGATVLKLVHAVPFGPYTQVVLAFSSSPFQPPYPHHADGVAILDLTVDCDMRSQVDQRVAKAAIGLMGSHIRVRRVRVIDYGTHVPGIECFPIGVASGDPRLPERVDCRIEDCVVEEPSLNGIYTNSCMVIYSGEDPFTGEMGYHRRSSSVTAPIIASPGNGLR
jgi:hypothetical protein